MKHKLLFCCIIWGIAFGSGSAASANYTVRITKENRRLAQVSCVLTMTDTLFSMNNNGADQFPDGYAHFVKNLTATDSMGNVVNLEYLGNALWKAKSDLKNPITLKYDILLEHDQQERKMWPAGFDEAPYCREDCIFWTGRALFIVPRVDLREIAVTFDVPSTWLVTTPWQRDESLSDSFIARDYGDLTDSFILAGTHSVEVIKLKDAEIVVGTGKSLAEPRAVLIKTLYPTQSLASGRSPRFLRGGFFFL